MKGAFKMLKNDMCITEIGEAFLKLWSSKDGSGKSSLKLENVVFQLLELPITAEKDVIIEH